MRSSDRFYALIPCAGVGARSGAPMPKQYCEVAGVPMLVHALRAFAAVAAIERTLVVLAPDDVLYATDVAPRVANLRCIEARVGGATRDASVRNGLDALGRAGARNSDWVLVHDAARPCVSVALIERLIDGAAGDAVGGIVALQVADTLKREALHSGATATAGAIRDDDHPRIGGTVPRDGAWLAQTPQMFRIGRLREALDAAREAGATVTDEASAIERIGLRPMLVRGHLMNFKVTYPEDFALASAWLERTSNADS